MDYLNTLPAELTLEISRYLWPSDLASLLCVCKRLHGLLECVLWSEIEGHDPGAHEEMILYPDADGEWKDYTGDEYYEGDEDYIPPSPPAPYQFMTMESRWTGRRYAKNFDEENFFSIIDTIPHERWQTLANKIRSLCLTSSDWSALEWRRVTECVNLENLELIGHQSFTGWDFTISAPPMAKLKNLRLRGYIPPQFVQHVCEYGTTLTHINLGILERSDKKCPIDNGGGVEMNPLTYGKHFFSWTSFGFTPHLTHLTHLHLCKPMSENLPGDWWSEVDFWELHDDIVYKEWADLLRTVSSTLTVLILEQRAFLLSIDADGDYRGRHLEKYLSKDSSNAQLREQILPVLLEETALFPSLTDISFRGINIPSETRAQLWGKFPTAKLTCIGFAYPLWVNNDGDEGDLFQDDCDGLMWTDKLEYMKLYGPAWRPK